MSERYEGHGCYICILGFVWVAIREAYYEEQYQARYPSTWLFDQRVALLKAGQMSSDDMLGHLADQNRSIGMDCHHMHSCRT